MPEVKYAHCNVNMLKMTDAKMEALKAEGWAFDKQLEDKLDKDGNVLVKKSNWWRFKRPDTGKATPGTPYLEPADVIQKFTVLFGQEAIDAARARGAKLASDTRKADPKSE